MGSGSDNRINTVTPVVVPAQDLSTEVVRENAPTEKVQGVENPELPPEEHRNPTATDNPHDAAFKDTSNATLPTGPLSVDSITRELGKRGNRSFKMGVRIFLGVDVTKTGVGGTVAPEGLKCEQTAEQYWTHFFTTHYGEAYTSRTPAEQRDFQEAYFAANAFVAAEVSGALDGAHESQKTRIIMDYAIALAENPQALGRLVVPGAANMEGLFHATRAETISAGVKAEIVAAATRQIPDDSEDAWMKGWAALAVDRGAAMLRHRLRSKGESPQWDRLEARVASLGEVNGENSPSGKLTRIRPDSTAAAMVADPEGDTLVEDLEAAITPAENTDPTKPPDPTDVLGNFIAGVNGLKTGGSGGAAKAAGFPSDAAAYSYYTKDPENDEVDKMIQGFNTLGDASLEPEFTYYQEDEGVGFSEVMDEMHGADLSAIGRGAANQAANAVAALQEQQNAAQVKTARIAEETDERVREFVEAIDLGNEAVDDMSAAREIKRSDPDAPLNPHPKSGT